MPNNTFTSTKDNWKKLADIDYFSMFVKAYIPFNAWMNLDYGTFDTDRAKINEIKRTPNLFHNKIVALLQDNGQEAVAFRVHIGELHVALEQAQIFNQDRRVSFTCIHFKSTNPPTCDRRFNGMKYHAHCKTAINNSTETIVEINNRKGQKVFSHTFAKYEYDIETVGRALASVKQAWKDELIGCYKSVAPLSIETLLDNSTSGRSIMCGGIRFISDLEKVTYGLIEVLFNLRNALLHGEINPNGDANKVYGAAYQILRCVIECL